MSTQQQPCFVMNVARIVPVPQNGPGYTSDPAPSAPKEKVMSYEEKSVGSTSFFKCEACPYMALPEDDIKFHLFTVHPELAKTNGLADNIQIQCPGCSSVFDAEETLRTHLRNHHKMGLKDVKKMVKSLVQIALKNAKLKKDEPINPKPAPPACPTPSMPQVIEIIPDTVNTTNEPLPDGVSYISVDELQRMSTPRFEKVDPKEIIQEASINIVYTEDVSNQYINPSMSHKSPCNMLKLSSVPPDLISSIPKSTEHIPSPPRENEVTHFVPQIPKHGRPKGSRTYTETDSKEEDLGKLCSVDNCHIRLKDEEKLALHRKCHQNGALKCFECGHEFGSIETLHTHLWKIHSQDLELPTCEICQYKTYSKRRLFRIHMKCHGTEKNYECETCSKVFKNTHQLAKHRIIHKKVSPEFTCQTCGHQFNTERKLRIHTEEVHDKVKPFKCPQCSYTTARKTVLRVHIRSHTGDKPYSCNKCTYSCSDHNSLRRHKKTHSKETPYMCKHCPYRTIQSAAFTSHMISKHPNVQDEIHRCPFCPFKSINKDKYVRHLTTHPKEKGIQLLIEMANTSFRWNIPSDNAEATAIETKADNTEIKETEMKDPHELHTIEVYDCDSQHDNILKNYPKNYSAHPSNNIENFGQQVITDLSKEDTNSDCLISESSNDNMMNRHQYTTQHHVQTVSYENPSNNLHFLNTQIPMDSNLMQTSSVNSHTTHSQINTVMSNNIMSNFPIRLPPVTQMSIRNSISLQPLSKMSFPITKAIGPIIKPTQILPVPSSSNSPVNIAIETEGAPRKKPKISVKSNLILKGPDPGNMFHSQQKMAFKRLEDNERFGLGPVTFNNLITTQFMQLPEPTLSESPNNIMSYPQETMMQESATPPVDSSLPEDSQMFTFNQQMNVNSINILPPQPKIQTTDPSYIKIEGTIKQNNQSPSLERMCNANAIMNNQAITRDYKASPPLEDIHKNISEIKNELKSDYYNIPMNNTASNAPVMDQFLIDNIIGEQYAAHLDLSTIVLPVMPEDQQNDVIEIDDNSDDNKLLPRFDMNFPLESLYLMHNDYQFFENDMQNNTELPVNEMNRMVTEVPMIPQKENMENTETQNNDFPNFIHGKKDPMMNTSVRPSTNKINVKNIELMKN